MRRMPSSAQRNQTRRAQPVIEGLEERQLLSGSGAVHAASTKGQLLQHGTRFTYNTAGKHVVIHVVGLGNLAGTTVDSSGDLKLVYGGTNAYSKIVGKVTGGNGRANLASIENSQLKTGNADNSISGVGGNVLQGVYLPNFDLVAGGSINLTSGVNTVILDTVGPDTQIQLRELPPPPTTTTATSSSLAVVSTQSGTTTGAAARSTTTTTTTSNTLEAGQSTSVTNEGITTTYGSGKDGSQTLTAVSGTFAPGSNIVEPLASGTPSQSPNPAPPGVILKVNQINGNSTGPVNLLTDPRIFGYDPTTGNVIRFQINLNTDTGTPDMTIPVPGDPQSVGLSLGWHDSQLDVLVSSGTTVYAYNATTGAADGSFTTVNSFLGGETVNSIGSVDDATVLGSYSTNALQMIDLNSSLKTQVAQPIKGSPGPFAVNSGLPAGFTLLGGLTSLPGSTSVIAAVAATFDTFQSTQPQLGFQPVNTTSVKVHMKKKNEPEKLEYKFSAGTATAVTTFGAYTPVTPNLPSPPSPGAALGSIDQSTALVASASGGTNTVNLSTGTLTLTYPNLLIALSQSFRPDLADSALIDIQGDVQSVRGTSANGMVLNDNGNLNLVQFQSLTNSTIVGQPLSHLNITSRSHDMILTPSRTITTSEGVFTNDGRNGVKVNTNLNPIGPLSQPGDVPPSA